MKLAPQDERILDKTALKAIVPFSSVHIKRLEEEGHFPRRTRIGDVRVGWYLSEVLAWMEERKKERDQRLEPFTLANWALSPTQEERDYFG